ncbi:DUF1642 domain-containing protein [Lacticaseibacillus zeae]|uniref:DUF1642 domain-containing protein n=1 Tax=Lacticaseibacillus zeae subsp. silagei TaxID=3068307 RepID=A0ABD7Z984_LACZE|nr:MULTISPECIES: DUF1642 domain-containing protein [Lacticaseibacillus]MDE3315286.1 DUF1642 domain-containing protein [Lacticaseibacillus zeae]WLV83682.1 DUF1642 domain-containing protein [Lacticaseibacillus sp. NCIMB 15475]WLV86438.1 DUF1642 domain-containing protein [Lacticaseibacillus sp. NCIMB 15474]
MSEEKLYAVKNDEGKYFDCEYAEFLPLSESYCPVMVSEDNAKAFVNDYGGHVVELIEKPNPEVVSKAEAKMLDKAKTASYPANYISMHAHPDPGANGTSYDELRLMCALINGYTVANEKKYNVKVPHTKEVWYYKSGDTDLLTICPADKKLRGKFTEAEIEHYGLQDCEKIWCDSDD